MSSVFEKIRHGNHLYVFYEGDLIYKQWLDENNSKNEPSMIFNREFPSERIIQANTSVNNSKENIDDSL